MFRKSIPMVALAALLAVTMAYAQQGASSATSTPATSSAPVKAAKATKMTAKKVTHVAKTDLNSASKEDLMKLPGVTDETAEKILAARPFKTKAELRSKGIVTKKEYAKIAMKVIAKQEPTANASGK
jgi:DNA uptake protein ComE-like DNA-binding protein